MAEPKSTSQEIVDLHNRELQLLRAIVVEQRKCDDATENLKRLGQQLIETQGMIVGMGLGRKFMEEQAIDSKTAPSDKTH